MEEDLVKSIYNKLLSEKSLVGETGKITFKLSNVEIVVKTKDVIGNILQDWFGEWMTKNKIFHSSPENTQDFPDFYLSHNHKENLLEVKSFDYNAGANFDVANFESYCRSLRTNAYRLDAKYLIFGYSMEDDGLITIKKVWLKNIWEICGPSEDYPLKIQQKQGMIYNIRPAKWYDNTRVRYKPFSSKKEFVCALQSTLQKYTKTKDESKEWYTQVEDNYYMHLKKRII